MAQLLLVFLLLSPLGSAAAQLMAPGDVLLRQDLQRLNDSGVINIPLTSWPLAGTEILGALTEDTIAQQHPVVAQILRRIYTRANSGAIGGWLEFDAKVSAAVVPRFIRTFEDLPREEGEVSAQVAWYGERWELVVSAGLSANPFDDEPLRPDGTYLGRSVGNWLLSAGWQERWWGPGHDSSLILSTNARPTPGVALQRKASHPFSAKWLTWIGPWSLTAFATRLDDDRSVDDTMLVGVRGSFRPPKSGLEVGITRVAQLCGSTRPCGLDTFADLLLGNDNSSVNVNPEDEPGNQLGGFDIRWRLPAQLPFALYVQWTGEDGRNGGGAVGSWLRQVGAEHWGQIGSLSHFSHVEVSDSMCREGGLGFSDKKPDCAYNHFIYRTGLRYRGRSLAGSTDSDSLSYSFGSTLVQFDGHTWNISLRHMDINRLGAADERHSLSAMPLTISDLQISHTRVTQIGRFFIGLVLNEVDGEQSKYLNSGLSGFVQWSNR